MNVLANSITTDLAVRYYTEYDKPIWLPYYSEYDKPIWLILLLQIWLNSITTDLADSITMNVTSRSG